MSANNDGFRSARPILRATGPAIDIGTRGSFPACWSRQANVWQERARRQPLAPPMSGTRSVRDFLAGGAAVGFVVWFAIIVGLAVCLILLAWLWIPLTGGDA